MCQLHEVDFIDSDRNNYHYESGNKIRRETDRNSISSFVDGLRPANMSVRLVLRNYSVSPDLPGKYLLQNCGRSRHTDLHLNEKPYKVQGRRAPCDILPHSCQRSEPQCAVKLQSSFVISNKYSGGGTWMSSDLNGRSRVIANSGFNTRWKRTMANLLTINRRITSSIFWDSAEVACLQLLRVWV